MSYSTTDKENVEKGLDQAVQPPSTVDAEDESHIRQRLAKYRLGRLFDAGVEARGVERVPETERENKHAIGLLLLWVSANMVLTTLPIGMLAQQVFTLTFPHALGVLVGFGIIGSLPVCFLAMLGPRFGMRTMIITRYSFGYVGAAVISVLNILTQLGFSVLGAILSGQVLHDINPHLPLSVSVLLIGVIGFIISFFGYNLVQYYTRYIWFAMLILFTFVFALGGQHGFQISRNVDLEDPAGHLRAADILSFGGIIFSSLAGWAPMAADFNVRLPANTSPIKIFALTLIGLMLPVIYIAGLGALLMTVPAYAEAYDNSDAAGVLHQVFLPWGHGGDFLLVLLALSAITDNIPSTYSAGLSMQALSPRFQNVPRVFFATFAFIIFAAASVAGRQHFSAILSNFLAVIAYWIAIWIVILVEEHYIFRRKDGSLGGYDLHAHDSPNLLPVGLAAAFASLCGVAGAIISMGQTWYIGPVAALLSPFGGDMGFEFAAFFTGVVYPPLRWLEIRKWKR